MDRDKLLFHKLNSIASWIILIGIVLMATWILRNVVGARKDFYNELWGPAHLLLHGESPYDTSVLRAQLPAVWLPMGISVFAPLGWLNEDVATRIWFFTTCVALLAMIVLTLQDLKSPLVAILSGLFACFFPPTIFHFTLGQFSIMTALCMMLAAHFVNKGHDWAAAILVAVGWTKPQLAILATVGLGLYYFRCAHWRGVFLFGFRLALAALVMSLPFFIVYPGWIQDWFAGMQRNPTWLHPSLFSILRESAGGWGYLLWGVTAVGGILLTLHSWKKFSPALAMAITLGITTAISPYIWSWDFVLLLPLWILAFLHTSPKRRVFLIITYLAAWMGMALVKTSANNDQLLWWVPWLFMGAVWVAGVWSFGSGKQDAA